MENEFSELADCKYYIYITLGIAEYTGFYYIGQHKTKKAGEKDEKYFGSGKIIRDIQKKHGMAYIHDKFVNYDLCWCSDREEADALEIAFIEKFKAMKLGDNYSTGGASMSDEEIARLSQSRKGKYTGVNHPNYGNRWNDEQRRRASEKLKGKRCGVNHPHYGKTFSDEVRQHMSEGRKGKYTGEQNHNYGKKMSKEHIQKMVEGFRLKYGVHGLNYGKHMSEELKKKISEARKGKYAGVNHPLYGKHLSVETKKKLNVLRGGDIAAYKDGIKVSVFHTTTEVKEFLNNSKQCVISAINSCIAGRVKSAYGYTWARES